MHFLRSLTVPALVLALIFAGSSASARTVRVDCTDGIPNPLVRAYQKSPYCDSDRSCDDVCTFAFCTLEDFLCSVHPNCAFPSDGACTPGENQATTIFVPAGRRRLLRGGTVHAVATRVILRCHRTPHRLPCP